MGKVFLVSLRIETKIYRCLVSLKQNIIYENNSEKEKKSIYHFPHLFPRKDTGKKRILPPKSDPSDKLWNQEVIACSRRLMFNSRPSGRRRTQKTQTKNILSCFVLRINIHKKEKKTCFLLFCRMFFWGW